MDRKYSLRFRLIDREVISCCCGRLWVWIYRLISEEVRFLLEETAGVTILFHRFIIIFRLLLFCNFQEGLLARREDDFWQYDNITLSSCPEPNHRW